MTLNYSLLGCYRNNIDGIPIVQKDPDTGQNKDYSINDCKKIAINNNSSIFGLQSNKNSPQDMGLCYLSNNNLSEIDQLYNAVEGGIKTLACNDGIGSQEKNSISVYANSNALNFFADLNLEENINLEVKDYLNKLDLINGEFNIAFTQVQNQSESVLQIYGINNIPDILNNSEQKNSFGKILNKYKSLKEELESKNENLLKEIDSLNKKIENLDNQDLQVNLQNIKINGSDMGAIEGQKDTNYQNVVALTENIILFIAICLITFIYLFNTLKNSNFLKNKIKKNKENKLESKNTDSNIKTKTSREEKTKEEKVKEEKTKEEKTKEEKIQ